MVRDYSAAIDSVWTWLVHVTPYLAVSVAILAVLAYVAYTTYDAFRKGR